MDRFDNNTDGDNISQTSGSTARWSMVAFELPGSDILRTGYLKKLKTKKEKFFVLRSTSSSGPARLEYHDNEKKFKTGQLPKRQIFLHACFNINKKSDTRQKNCIALYLRDECFSVVARDATEMQIWLDLLLDHQNEYIGLDQSPYPHYEYIWQVDIKPKGLGVSKHLTGGYRLCLGEMFIAFVRNQSDKVDFTVQMASIRKCGHTGGYFFMELGRSSPTGCGELWMQVDDSTVAQNMHEVLLSAMRGSQDSFRSRSNTSSSVHRHRDRDSEIDGHDVRTRESSHHEVRPREGSYGQGSLKKKNTQRPFSSFSPEVQIPPSTSPGSEHTYENVPIRGTDSGGYRKNTLKSTSSLPDERKIKYISPGILLDDRNRSNSLGSQDSRHSVSKVEHYGSSPAQDKYIRQQQRGATPEIQSPSLPEENPAYLPMSSGQRSPSPAIAPERPGSSGSDHESGNRGGGYMDMKPGSSVGSVSSMDTGYIDMAPSHVHVEKEKTPSSLNTSGYLVMGPGQTSKSAPIPIRPSKEPGYMEMGPSSQPLPQIKESGSGEAYLPMTPTAQSPVTDNLRPTQMTCYLSDDSMSGDFPKRSFSLGSRPLTKNIRHQNHVNHVENPPKETVTSDNNGRWLSAPHLIAQKMKQHNSSPSYANTEVSLSSSPMSQSLRSEDSEAMMEMEYRPRAATGESYRPNRQTNEAFRPRAATSESYHSNRSTVDGFRPRASSIGKLVSQHRQRSSSYGQQSKLAQLAHDVRRKVGSFESVNSPGMDYQNTHRTSTDSLGQFSYSSKASSSESLRLSSRNSEYVDMHLDKSIDTGYIDMSIGTPKSTKSSACHSRSSSNQSLSSSPAVSSFSASMKHEPSPSIKIVNASDTSVHRSPNVLSVVNSRSSHLNRSPVGSGRESEDESYVPYAPGTSAENKESRISKLERKPVSTSHNSERRPGSRSGSFGSDNNFDSRSNSFGSYSHPDPDSRSSSFGSYSMPGSRSGSVSSEINTEKRSGSFKLDNKKSKSKSKKSKGKTHNELKRDPIPKKPHNTDVDNPYIEYEPGTLVIGNSNTHTSRTSSPHSDKVKTKENSDYMECDATEIKTFTNSSNPLPLYSLSGDPLFSDAAISTKTDSVRREENEEKQPEHCQEKVTDKVTESYMEYNPAISSKLDSVKSPTKVRSYLNLEDKQSVISDKSLDKHIQDESLFENPYKLNSKVEYRSLPNKSVVKGQKEICGKLEKCEGGKETVVKQVLQVKPVVVDDYGDDDGGYVGLDFGDKETHRTEPAVLIDVDYGQDAVFKDKDSSCCKTLDMKSKSVGNTDTENKTRKVSVDSLNRNSASGSLGDLKTNKTSVSSLEEIESMAMRSQKEKDRSCESLNTKVILPQSFTSEAGSELHKQQSMPCMNVDYEKTPAVVQDTDVSEPHNRHSCSDLSSEYEQMSFPTPVERACSQQLTPVPTLNYAKLDLGSNEDIGNGETKLVCVKNRHPPSPDDSVRPFQYAQIDFEMTDSHKNTRNKDKVKFSLE